MGILLVQDNRDLGLIWSRFLERRGFDVTLATTQEEAMAVLEDHVVDVLIVEPVLAEGGGLPVADFATYRNPDVVILAVTRSSFFAESTIFDVMPNARCVMRTPVRPEDIAAYLDHFGARRDTSTLKDAASAV